MPPRLGGWALYFVAISHVLSSGYDAHISRQRGTFALTAVQCYLGAWTYAKEQQAGSSIPTQDSKGAVAALHKKFIPNWTSEEFKAAVNTLADVANEWAEKAGVGEENSCEELWLRTLELEAKFWPSA